MPLSVVCSSCGAKLRRTDNSIGRAFKCPKCGNQISVAAVSRSRVEQPRPLQGSEVAVDLPISRRADSVDEAVGASKVPLGFGIASLALSVIGLVLSLIPCVGAYFAIPLSGLGLLLGIVGAIFALVRQGRGIGFPLAGSITGFAGIGIAVLWLTICSGLLGSANKAVSEVSKEREKRVEQAKKESEAPENWADATKTSLQRSDVEVWLSAARVEFIRLDMLGQDGQSQDKNLAIYIKIKNKSTTKKINYESWGGQDRLIEKHRPFLEDNFGNKYRGVSFGFGTKVVGQIKDVSIHPDQVIDDLLVFETPLANVQYLRLTLPASAFGGNGDLRFQIPESVIQR